MRRWTWWLRYPQPKAHTPQAWAVHDLDSERPTDDAIDRPSTLSAFGGEGGVDGRPSSASATSHHTHEFPRPPHDNTRSAVGGFGGFGGGIASPPSNHGSDGEYEPFGDDWVPGEPPPGHKADHKRGNNSHDRGGGGGGGVGVGGMLGGLLSGDSRPGSEAGGSEEVRRFTRLFLVRWHFMVGI